VSDRSVADRKCLLKQKAKQVKEIITNQSRLIELLLAD
jgi:hypothetical protein